MAESVTDITEDQLAAVSTSATSNKRGKIEGTASDLFKCKGKRQFCHNFRRVKSVFFISACHSTSSVWLCVSCGVLGCGRYVNGHGLKHFEQGGRKHPVCMETKETSVFW